VKISAGQAEMPTLPKFITFGIFWPSFAAGPITEIGDLGSENQFPKWSDRSRGLLLVSRGFAKKAFADAVALYLVAPRVDLMIWSDGSNKDTFLLFLGNLLFVYFDFSGYSDIAIGSARLAGFRIPENFNSPLTKSNLRHFWQSWHISLTRWVNRNVFVPLSMATRRETRAISYAVPVFATTIAIGIWHGLQPVWLLWGIHHALGIMLTDLWGKMLPLAVTRLSILDTKPAKIVRYVGGVCFVWYWLMLSYSFTISSNLETALRSYWRMLILPIDLAYGFLATTL
jgi:alginate O-acetyltransferase complex protein AlgI